MAVSPESYPGLFRLIVADLRAKAKWMYEEDRGLVLAKVLLTDGTMAMIWYRWMQWSRRYRLAPLEMLFNKINSFFCNCIIGRGAEFGPGFVLIHSTGVVINGTVRGGANVFLEHQVTIGAERRQAPVLGNDIFIGAGAKIIGSVTIGDGACIGSNSVINRSVKPYEIVAGNPAIHVRFRFPQNIIDDLLKIKWWNWETVKIKKNCILLLNDDITKSINELKALSEK